MSIVQLQANWKLREEHQQSNGFLSTGLYDSSYSPTSDLLEVCFHLLTLKNQRAFINLKAGKNTVQLPRIISTASSY